MISPHCPYPWAPAAWRVLSFRSALLCMWCERASNVTGAISGSRGVYWECFSAAMLWVLVGFQAPWKFVSPFVPHDAPCVSHLSPICLLFASRLSPKSFALAARLSPTRASVFFHLFPISLPVLFHLFATFFPLASYLCPAELFPTCLRDVFFSCSYSARTCLPDVLQFLSISFPPVFHLSPSCVQVFYIVSSRFCWLVLHSSCSCCELVLLDLSSPYLKPVSLHYFDVFRTSLSFLHLKTPLVWELVLRLWVQLSPTLFALVSLVCLPSAATSIQIFHPFGILIAVGLQAAGLICLAARTFCAATCAQKEHYYYDFICYHYSLDDSFICCESTRSTWMRMCMRTIR